MRRTDNEAQAKVQQEAMATRQRQRRAEVQVSQPHVAVPPRASAAVPPYSMRLDWDSNSCHFVVTVPELPGCWAHGRTRAEAVGNGEEVIAAWLGRAHRFGDPVPDPTTIRFASDSVEGEWGGRD